MSTHTFACGCSFPLLEEAPPGGFPLLSFQWEDVRLDCPAVWELLASGRTRMVFQLETPLGQKWSQRMRPESIDHLAALAAILRPGMLNARDEKGVSMTEHYCRRKNGEEAVEIPHPALEEFLRPVYGCMPFQEVYMRIAAEIAGFDLLAVDRLRKATAQKDMKLVAAVGADFVAGCAKVGKVPEGVARLLWSWIAAAGRYAFNCAHSVSYALLGYYTAWAKVHLPIPAFAAWLACAEEHDDIGELVEEAASFGVEVVRPDLALSGDAFTTDRVRVRYGLSNIRGVGLASVTELRSVVKIAESYLGKPLAQFSWFELYLSVLVKLKANVSVNLVRSGACDSWGVPRARMAAELDVWRALTKGEREWVQARAECEVEKTCKEKVGRNLTNCLAPYGETLPRQRPEGVPEGEWADLKETVRLDSLRLAALDSPPFFSAEDMLASLAENHCRNERQSVVQGLLDTLKNPPTPLVDSVRSRVADEEYLLGIAVTAHRLDQADLSQANCTVSDFLKGRKGPVLLGVELAGVRPCTTKKGKSPGAKMAQLVLKDRTGTLKGVCFPEAFARCGHLLQQGHLLLIQGKGSDKEQGQIIVESAWLPGKPTAPLISPPA